MRNLRAIGMVLAAVGLGGLASKGATVGDIQQAAAQLIGGVPVDWSFSDFDTTGVWGYPKIVDGGWAVNGIVADSFVAETLDDEVSGLIPGRYYELYVVAAGNDLSGQTWSIQTGFAPKAYSLSTTDIASDETIPGYDLSDGLISSPFRKNGNIAMHAVRIGAIPADSNGVCRVSLQTGVGLTDALGTGVRCMYDGLLYRQVPAPSHPADLQSDSWVAVDALGRALPDYAEAGTQKSLRTVGIFYFLWLGQHSQTGPWNITDLLAANPTNTAWGPVNNFHHWGESEMGYYRSDDPYVIRRHVSMLVDAGVDVVIFDVTNAFIYENVYKKLCAVYMQIRAEGGRTPQICFLTHSSSVSVVQQLYDKLYAPGLYPDLWFRWKGKPLMLADLTGHSPEVEDFFTIRYSWFRQTGLDKWSWLDQHPQDYGWHEAANQPEQVAVAVASHPGNGIGRSYQGGVSPPVDLYSLTGTEGQGYCFAEQWERALELDPEFIFVTGWNEWVAQRFISDRVRSYAGGTKQIGDSYFVDAYNMEFNRDAEPMKDGTTDNYYYQLVSNIRKYKGVRPPVPGTSHPVSIDGVFGDWEPVGARYYDTYGDPCSRNWRGWGDSGLAYTNDTGRNDILQSRATFDGSNVFFYVETAAPLTPCTDPHWMELFINADQDYSTGWQGYDYRVNGYASNGTAVVEQSTGAAWVSAGAASFQWQENKMEMAIPRLLVGLVAEPVEFDFHWADNIQVEDDITEFSISGDSAPNRRFNYRYSSAAQPPIPSLEFHYEADGDFEGWNDEPRNIDGFTVANGALSGIAVTADPYFHNFSVDFDGSEISKIAVRLRATAAGAVQLYWVPNGGGWNYLQTSYSQVGEWQVVEFDCSKSGAWAGQRIGVLRLDPIGVAGAGFDVDWIRSAKGDADADGIPDNTEDLVDSDEDGVRDYLDEDSDNDGETDWYENILGSNPLDPLETAGILYLNWTGMPGSTMQVSVAGRAGRSYTLRKTASLKHSQWIPVAQAGPLAVDLPVILDGDVSTNPSAFYQLYVEKPE